MERLYQSILSQHFQAEDMMAFLAGPRQAGKTTSAEMLAQLHPHTLYLNWDEQDHRSIILAGSEAISETAHFNTLKDDKVFIVFDELHKYKDWKQFLKGFYDLHRRKANILVTGSSRLNVFRRGGDSMMGRYFLYRMHPLSVAETISTELPDRITRIPKRIPDDNFNNLYQYGGFPKPFIKHDAHFSNRWHRMRQQQLAQEDIRDNTRIQELQQLEILVELLKNQSAQQLNYVSLAKKIRVTVETISRWIEVLNSFYYCYTIRPWQKNITRSLLKEPKLYLWDWSLVKDEGARFENFVASHLLKAVQFWTDMGYGEYDLFYIRTKDQEEVDFIVTKDSEPWFIVEAKCSSHSKLNPNLHKFQQATGAKHALQVCLDLPFVAQDCFKETGPIKVPAKTFLSQLV